MRLRQWGTERLAAAGVVVLLVSGCAVAGSEQAAPRPRLLAVPPLPEQLVGGGDPIFPRQGNPGYDASSDTWDLKVDPEANTLSPTASGCRWTRRGRTPRPWKLDSQPARFLVTGDKPVVETELSADQSFEVTLAYEDTPEPTTVRGWGTPRVRRPWRNRSRSGSTGWGAPPGHPSLFPSEPPEPRISGWFMRQPVSGRSQTDTARTSHRPPGVAAMRSAEVRPRFADGPSLSGGSTAPRR